MSSEHTRALGPKIAADYRLLNHLRGRSTMTTADIEPESMRIDVEGGVIPACQEDHEEVPGCWYFYRLPGNELIAPCRPTLPSRS
jgi:hypothetical protein